MNVYELHHREKKVGKLLAAVPLATTDNERDALVECLEASNQASRDKFAAKLGVRSPSLETWRALVLAVRVRHLATENDVREAAFVRRVS